MHDQILPKIWKELDQLKKAGFKKTYESIENELIQIESDLKEYVEISSKY